MSGHAKGNLNIIAIRKGWSRNFTLEAEAVETMDYSTLEHLLELDTLKLRAARLRMFVEQPAGSGTFLSVRNWKDDGSLQTSLMRGFFVERAQSQVPMVFDIRDEDLTPALPGRASEKAREWIKTHTLPRGSASNTPSNELGAPEIEESAAQEQSASAANGGFFGMFKGSPAATPSKDSPPTPPPSDPDVDAEKEEDVLLQRGWKRVLRPLTRKKTKKESTTASDADIQADGDGEQVEMPDPKDVSAAALLVSDKQSKASGISFITRRKSKKDVKGKGKDADAPPVPSKQES